MADISQTAASVLAGANTVKIQGTAGEALTAGNPVYQDPTTLQWLKADNNAAGKQHAIGIALNACALNQPVTIAKSGPVNLGATLTPGTGYYLSGTAGAICPLADLASGMSVCLLGLAISATQINLDVTFPNVTL